MKMTLTQAFDMIARNETPEEYEKRQRKLSRYCSERDDLICGIEVLEDTSSPAYDPALDPERAAKKRARLEKVLAKIEELK